jgi:hypothetical protein
MLAPKGSGMRLGTVLVCALSVAYATASPVPSAVA